MANNPNFQEELKNVLENDEQLGNEDEQDEKDSENARLQKRLVQMQYLE